MPFLKPVRRTRVALCALLAAWSALASAADPKVYVGNFKDNTVSVIDTGKGVVTATLAVAAGPHGMVLSPDGRMLYVSGDGSSQVSMVDTASDSVVKALEVGKAPQGLAMAPDGKRLLHFFWMRAAKHNFAEWSVYAVIVALLLGWRIRQAWLHRRKLSALPMARRAA